MRQENESGVESLVRERRKISGGAKLGERLGGRRGRSRATKYFQGSLAQDPYLCSCWKNHKEIDEGGQKRKRERGNTRRNFGQKMSKKYSQITSFFHKEESGATQKRKKGEKEAWTKQCWIVSYFNGQSIDSWHDSHDSSLWQTVEREPAGHSPYLCLLHTEKIATAQFVTLYIDERMQVKRKKK